MAYFTKQKFKISDLARVPKSGPSVLLVISEESLREIYLRHLLRHNFEVNCAAFGNPYSISQYLDEADLLVLDIKNFQEADRLKFLKALAQKFPSLPVVTIGLGLSEAYIKTIMALGVAGHLDRQFSRPEDLAQVVKTLFNPPPL
ncbi:MAG: response regulator [Candidatus Doudnabacteria bacterium]|nr:response regulator [Candidatus Doudnabacteria bacterium]